MGPTLRSQPWVAKLGVSHIAIIPDTGKLKTKEFLGLADLQPSQENKSPGFRVRSPLNVKGGERYRSAPDDLASVHAQTTAQALTSAQIHKYTDK